MKPVPEKYKDYNNPPLIESIVDIQIPFDPNQLTSIEKLCNTPEIKSRFPNNERLVEKTAQINVVEGSAAFSDKHIGFRLMSEDKTLITQFKSNGFTFSVIGKYNGWKNLIKNADDLWAKYKNVVGPKLITRIAVRYINRIDIPSLNFNIEDYFHVYPKIFEPTLNGFFLQVQIPQAEGGMAIINQGISPPTKVGFTSILLDIDIFDPKIIVPDETNIFKRLEILRGQKNRLFEKCITDKTRELFS